MRELFFSGCVLTLASVALLSLFQEVRQWRKKKRSGP